MANNFDPHQNPVYYAPSENVPPNLQQDDSNTSNYRRPVYKSFWTRQTSVDINNPVYAPAEQQYPRQSNSGFSFFNVLNRSLSRLSDSIDSNAQSLFSSTTTSKQVPQGQPAYNQSAPVRVPPYNQSAENRPPQYNQSAENRPPQYNQSAENRPPQYNQAAPFQVSQYNQPAPVQAPQYNQAAPAQAPPYNKPAPVQAPQYNQTVPVQAPPYNQPAPVPAPQYNQAVPAQAPPYNQPAPVQAPQYNQTVPVQAPPYNQPAPVPAPQYNQAVPAQAPPYNQPAPVQAPQYNQAVPAQAPPYNQPATVQAPQYNQAVPAQIPQYNQPAPVPAPQYNQTVPVQAPQYNQPAPVQVSPPVQQPNPYSADRQLSFQGLPNDQAAVYPSDNNEMQGEAAYHQDQHHNYEKPPKKKGLTSKIDRLVQRMSKLNKQPQLSKNLSDSSSQSGFSQPFASVDSNSFERELTADELALIERYSDKTQMKIINLPVTDQTQPVDVHFHHETNRIYSCDVSRSVVEIYDLNGALQHKVEDPTMLKFQPTAIVVACDGTMIIASHFNHCLYMYSPSETSRPYAYKQFRLGSQGNQVHQFFHPAGIGIDHTNGNLYVCDRGNCRIQVIRSEGFCERVIELFLNSKKKTPLDPVRIALQENFHQLVCIIGNGDAICFLPKDATERVYVDPLYIHDGNGLGLEGAAGLATDAEGRIFISDTNHNRIVLCTPEGGFLTSFGTQTDGIDQIKRPCGLAVSNDGTVVVAEPGNKRLHLFGLAKEEVPVNTTLLVDTSTEPPNEEEKDLVENL